VYVFECGSIVYDEHTLSEEELLLAVKVRELPEPEVREGYYAQIRANIETQELYYDYIPI
jgi:hypothetical protein